MHPDPSQSLSNGVTGPSAILFPYPPPSLGCECHPRARQREYLTQPRGPGRGLLDWEQFHQFAARIRVLGETEHPKTLYIYDPYQQLHCGRCHEVVVAPGTLFVRFSSLDFLHIIPQFWLLLREHGCGFAIERWRQDQPNVCLPPFSLQCRFTSCKDSLTKKQICNLLAKQKYYKIKDEEV